MAKTTRPKPTIEERQDRRQESIASAPSEDVRPYDGKVISARDMFCNPRELSQLLRRDGWKSDPREGNGSHRVFRHPDRPTITIPYRLKLGTLNDILVTAGYKVR